MKRPGKAVVGADRKTAETMLPYEDSLAVKLLDPIADLADQPPLRLLCGALIAFGIVRGNGRMARAGVRMLAAHSLATWTKSRIKHRVDRTRPHAVRERGKDAKARPGDSEASVENSFPSGHSAGAAAVARAFARDYPEHKAAAYGAAAVLALAQIPRCAHYPSDVGAGLAIGLAAEEVVTLSARGLASLAP